jgi:hypothetical protein
MRPSDHWTALVMAGVGVVAVAWLPAPACWGAGAGAGALALLWLAVRGHWRRGVVARLKGFVWDRQTFCQHFLITGATGSGKTLSGILPLLFQVFKHQPRFGGLCVDVKGVLHEAVVAMAKKFGRPNAVIVLQVRPTEGATTWRPTHRFNLVGDRSIPFTTYARCVVDTAVAMGNRQEQSFFRQAAQIHIAAALEALAALGYEVTLENAHNLLVNPADTQAAARQLEGTPLGEHLANYLAQPPEQLAGVIGTVKTELPVGSEAGNWVCALFFKGFARLVNFLARAYDDLGCRHRGRQHQLQCLQELLLTRTGRGHMPGHHLPGLRRD